jgi:F0F1-type ATP synthase membrane subunit c/vacuolar-type H+-ATPase subunit K
MNIDLKGLTASWKTSLAGIAAIALGAYQAYMGTGGIQGAIHDPAVQSLFVLGVIGLLAKDHNVTGGTKGQPSAAHALEEANQAPARPPDQPKIP